MILADLVGYIAGIEEMFAKQEAMFGHQRVEVCGKQRHNKRRLSYGLVAGFFGMYIERYGLAIWGVTNAGTGCIEGSIAYYYVPTFSGRELEKVSDQ